MVIRKNIFFLLAAQGFHIGPIIIVMTQEVFVFGPYSTVKFQCWPYEEKSLGTH